MPQRSSSVRRTARGSAASSASFSSAAGSSRLKSKGKGGRGSCECSPVFALFSVIGAMQVAVLLYFLMGYVTGPSHASNTATKFLQEIDADAPPGVQRNVVHHSDSGSSGSHENGAAAQQAIRDELARARQRPAEPAQPLAVAAAAVRGSSGNAPINVDPSQSSYNNRNRDLNGVYENRGKYTPNDAWLRARPDWLNNPLREKPRPPASNWDAKAKSAPKYPAQADLAKIFADVERLYFEEANANMQSTRGQYVLRPAKKVPGTQGDQCLDNLGHGVGESVGVFQCHGSGGSQAWTVQDGRVCQTAVKKQVCLTVVDSNRGVPNSRPSYAVEFWSPETPQAKALLDAQLWDMKMKTVHGDINIKSRVKANVEGGSAGLCLTVQADTELGKIPEIRVDDCETSPTAIWSKELFITRQASNAKPVDPDYEEYAFNKPLSMKIGTHREEPERRPQQCLQGVGANDEVGKYDPDSETLPTASVVIAFVNEEFYTLMRTVWAVLQESPPHLLHEVFIVDDGSDVEWLHAPLEEYLRIAMPDKVKVLRLSHRQGLVQARLKGARAATGDVLVFLDSHVEATKGWLQPLLRRIKADRTLAVCPEIPAISTTSLDVGRGSAQSKGVFDWTMTFTWAAAAHPDPSVPIISPTMAGGLFAIERNFFFEVGTYDEGMMVWGAENLEMSFRLWTCGGGIEIVPCSVVAHIYRSVTGTLAKRSGDYISLNTRRLVDVWLDEFKDVYYSGNPQALSKPVGEHLDDRIAVRKAMKCKPFSSYLDEHFPDMIRPNKDHTQARGFLRNPATNLCWDTGGSKNPGATVGLYICHHMGGNQAVAFTRQDVGGQIFSFAANNCLAFSQAKNGVQVSRCKGAGTHWMHNRNDKTMRPQQDSRLCAFASGSKLGIKTCDGSPDQQWEWSEYVS